MNAKQPLNLSRSAKRAILWATDSLIVPISLYLAVSLRYGTIAPYTYLNASWVLFPAMILVGFAVIYIFRLDRTKLHAFETNAVSRLALAAACLSVSAILISFFLGLNGPRSVPLIFGTLVFILTLGARMCAVSILRWYGEKGENRTPVAIYGAGAAGTQLALALNQSKEARPVFFVDDNPSLVGLVISGLPVCKMRDLEKLIQKHRINQVLVAIPSLSKSKQIEIVEQLKDMPAEVKVLPSYVELMAGTGIVESLRPITPDALLGRDMVDLDTPEVTASYAGRVVMVTGAGGSIGSELCRQLLNCNPRRIVLFERSEYQLYMIDMELRAEAAKLDIEITTRLGSVTDPQRVKAVIAQERVEIILHAAAYKHVPLVEENELEGARNNVLGTQVVAAAAEAAGIKRFILISTDKAVRPTNIMGATKRLAELVVQDMQTRSTTTKFAMVRFGNVLGSSGSVLPLFQSQIAQGGPVTVTHKDVTRFFMTIPEAARLVLLAGAYASGGDVFVLDMGKPQKIIDIAYRMVALSGREVKDPVTGEGDIAIEITGLRPGEKLYEELLIDNASLVGTPHRKILRAQEAMLSQIEVAMLLRELRAAIDAGDEARLRDLIAERVAGYHLQQSEHTHTAPAAEV
ncbi:MAG: nucleoside-diphosphate sugar epimerase/dehydratase [Pseudomonadota bacterium]